MSSAFHQELVARDIELALEVGAVADLLGFRGLGDDQHVGDISDQVIALGVRRHRRKVLPDVFFRGVEVALADLGAVHFGDDGIVLRKGGGYARDERDQDKTGEKSGHTVLDR